MIDIKKIISLILIACLILSAIPIASFALSWDGSSAGGSTNAVNGSSTGYVIRSTNDDACVVGYRFSAVTSSGTMKVNKVIDVYRKTSNGNNAYSTSAKFSTKYNKKQLIANKNSKLSTTSNTTNCYKETAMGFTTALPNPSSVGTWQSYEANINKVLSQLGVGSVSNMNYGDKVIVEPLFDVCLAGEYQALTVTEMAYCGRSVKGGSSDGGTSSTSASWGFISSYTNRIWPNKLYTPDGQGLWTGVSAIGSSSKATFDTILTKGYGAGIAYNETHNGNYTIKFNGNGSTSGSTASMTMTRGTAKNLTANGFKKTGNSFVKWNTKADGTGTSYNDKQSVNNLANAGGTITLYAQWKPNELYVSYNANGGALNSSTYYLSSNIVHTASTKKICYLVWTYNNAKANGLHNDTTFGLYRTGYRFVNWGTSASGGTTFGQDDATLKPSQINSGIANGTVYTTLYAQWEFDPVLSVNKCEVYDGNKGSTTKLYGISKGNVFDDYEYKTDYPTIGNTVWFNVYFPAETESIKVRQYVKNGGSWITRDVTLSNASSSQWFPVQFENSYKTISSSTSNFSVQAKMDWILVLLALSFLQYFQL